MGIGITLFIRVVLFSLATPTQLNTIVTLMVTDYSSIAQTLTMKYLLPEAVVAM